jgi:hypothetical protein
MFAALDAGKRGRATAVVAQHAIEEGVFSSDLNTITHTTQEDYEKKVKIETTREKLMECANGAFVQAVFRKINSSNKPVRHLLNHSARIENPLVWNEHRQRTLFVVAPTGSEFGKTIVHEKNWRGKSKEGATIAQRPIPIWIIGTQPSDDRNAWDYYAISPRIGNGEANEVKNRLSEYSDIFDLLHVTSSFPLTSQVTEPTALEAEEAFDQKDRYFRLSQTRSSKDASLYPKVTTIETAPGISDVDMQNYQVSKGLLEFAGAYDLNEAIAENEIQKYFDARKIIEQWDGDASVKGAQRQFDQFVDEYRSYEAFFPVLGLDPTGYKNWRGNERFRNLR